MRSLIRDHRLYLDISILCVSLRIIIRGIWPEHKFGGINSTHRCRRRRRRVIISHHIASARGLTRPNRVDARMLADRGFVFIGVIRPVCFFYTSLRKPYTLSSGNEWRWWWLFFPLAMSPHKSEHVYMPYVLYAVLMTIAVMIRYEKIQIRTTSAATARTLKN